ncbi:MAG: hypothetical protein GF383_01845, partial [Candidatus Lokiarchaeota archaeon]|nr:hypothetical protein [Candidatus Lokiarchaeota archaeon]MBD3338087.1 hypothetical protein [Candidatus Lokiarchaeota archaeon]
MNSITVVERNENLEDIYHCPECGGNLINILELGQTVCCQCGLITDERKFDGSHSGPRTYTKEQQNKRARTGSPINPMLPDLGLCVTYDKNVRNHDLKRALKINSYLPWDKKNLLIAMTEIKRLCHNLNIPDYIRKAAYDLYREALSKDIVKGRSILGMVAVCLYYTCKIKKIPRTFKEIMDESSVSEKKLRSFYSALVEILNLKAPVNNPVANIPRFIANLGLGFEVEKLTIRILEEYFKKHSLGGKNPNGICGGAIYLAAKFNNKRVNQKTIADIVGVTDSTLRARYYDIIDKVN